MCIHNGFLCTHTYSYTVHTGSGRDGAEAAARMVRSGVVRMVRDWGSGGSWKSDHAVVRMVRGWGSGGSGKSDHA